MNICIMHGTFTKNVQHLSNRDQIPRIGDKIDIFNLTPTPIVRNVVWNDLLTQVTIIVD